MAIINFGALNDGDKIRLAAGDILSFGMAIDAADVEVAMEHGHLILGANGTTVSLRKWAIGNINLDQIEFVNGSELLVGDTVYATTNDNDANIIQPSVAGLHDDQLRGMNGNDEMHGGDGQDLLLGQQGDDTLYGDDGNDRLDGGEDLDTIYGGLGNDKIRTGESKAGNDIVYGGDNDDMLLYQKAGRASQLELHGDDGIDIIIGGAGNDKIYGGAGADEMNGKDGKDIYITTTAESPAVADNYDKVKFETEDDTFDLEIEGRDDNYIEEALSTNDFGTAFGKAVQLLAINEGTKDYVFIAGTDTGWLFGEFTDDNDPDLAIEILKGNDVDKLEFADIV